MKYQEYCPKCDRVTPSRAVRGSTTVEYVCAVCGLSVGMEFLDDAELDELFSDAPESGLDLPGYQGDAL